MCKISTYLHTTLCDDERAEIANLASLVNKWATMGGIDVKITNFESAESFLFHYEDNKAVDILLLDIQMKIMDGVALARKIRKEDKNMQIVFITGYMDYIADGYDVEALHYLLKPVAEEKLFLVLNRAVEKLNKNGQMLTLQLMAKQCDCHCMKSYI